jgi:hypothetical protein
MALTLRPIADSPEDQHVMHGEWRVGQIEKRPPLIGLAPRWTWSLNGVPWGTPEGCISQALRDRSMRPRPS